MVNSIKHFNFSLIIFFFIILLNDTTQAQSPIQPASPLASPTVLWDVSSIVVIVGAIIITILLIIIFILFLRRVTNPSMEELAKRELGIGINPQLLKTFPILLYSSIINNLKQSEDQDPLECAVCLGDFNDNDIVRVLPQCNHVFHPPCIDAWLSNHSTCPVCRTNLNHQCSCQFAITIESNQR